MLRPTLSSKSQAWTQKLFLGLGLGYDWSATKGNEATSILPGGSAPKEPPAKDPTGPDNWATLEVV